MLLGGGAVGLGLLAVLGVRPAAAGDTSRPIEVRNPLKLPASLPADRTSMTPVDANYSYKPTLAMLPNGELVLMAFYWSGSYSEGAYHEWSTMWRSTDYGKSWATGVRAKRTDGQDLAGREHWLTAIDDGTEHGILFTTAAIMPRDSANPQPKTWRSSINRSTDGGVTWQQIWLPTTWWEISRNVVEMPDGKLQFGMSADPSDPSDPSTYNDVWFTSTDKGLNWTAGPKITPLPSYVNFQGTSIPYNGGGGFFVEAYTHRDTKGNLRQFVRNGPGNPMYPMDANPPGGTDEIDRTLMTTSADGGTTWSTLQDIGDYGQHYTRVTRLKDGRLLMTFTQRGITEPFGLRAILSYDDGKTWDFGRDQIILDDNTPSGWTSGGGFGNTIQLPDGSLISAYSYPTTAAGYQYPRTKVVRWSLPSDSPEPSTTGAVGCRGVVPN